MFKRGLILSGGLLLATLTLTTGALAAEGVALRSGTLRAGPATSYPAVASVSDGDDLEIYGCLSGYAWCDVSDGDNRGWIRGSRIDFLRDNTRYAISDSYSDFGLAVLSFSLGDYWGNYYGERPWFANRQWRRGPNALPSNWQSNRANWVHPQPVVGRQPLSGPGTGSQPGAGVPHHAGPSRLIPRANPGKPPANHPVGTVPVSPAGTNPATVNRVRPNSVKPSAPAHAFTAPGQPRLPHAAPVQHQQAPAQHVQRPAGAPHVQRQAPANARPQQQQRAPQQQRAAPPAAAKPVCVLPKC